LEDRCAFGVELSVDAYGAVEIHDAFELNPFSKKGEIVVV